MYIGMFVIMGNDTMAVTQWGKNINNYHPEPDLKFLGCCVEATSEYTPNAIFIHTKDYWKY